MYGGALIGQRIQSSGFSSVPPRSTTTAPIPTAPNSSSATQTTARAATTTNDSKPNLIQQQWSTILPGVNGKVTAECLWNACRAIFIGTTLIAIGAAMATVGYYANELSLEEQTTGNLTVKVKNTTRGFHLHNLSYLGPIIMGFGGFILVAACVMTFEARDNASKIVPARYLNKLRDTTVGVTDGGQINTSLFSSSNNNEVQLQWDVVSCISPKLNLFQTQQQQVQQFAGSWESSTCSRGDLALTVVPNRSTLTADFIHFSKTLQKCIDSKQCSARNPLKQPEVRLLASSANNALNINRSPSAPDFLSEAVTVQHIYAPKSYYSPVCLSNFKWSSGRPDQVNSIKGRLRAVNNHNLLFLPRQAVSVDNPRVDQANSMMATPTGNANAVPKSESDASMTMDLHFPDGSITLMVKDESKQSKQGDGGCANSTNANSPNNAQERKDTTKRPPLLRQCRVEHADSDLEFNNPG